MRVRISLLLPAVACCLLFASQAQATDYAYGYTSVYVDSASIVRGYHRTEVDYNTDVYYRPYVCASLYKDGTEVVRACGGGFASATRNTQTSYSAGSTYSALTDHYVNIEYEEEDPYNPGYYYYPDYLGYSFSGSGSHPIDWYYVASGIYNSRPDESIHLGDTTAQICSKPTGEITSSSGWADDFNLPTVHKWTQTLTPSTVSFSGRSVKEFNSGIGTDSCWFPNSVYEKVDHVTPGDPWTINSDNTWGPDGVGWRPETVAYYRYHQRAPCGFTVTQRMDISCGGFSFLNYKFNTLGASIGATTVSSTRDGQTVTRIWF